MKTHKPNILLLTCVGCAIPLVFALLDSYRTEPTKIHCRVKSIMNDQQSSRYVQFSYPSESELLVVTKRNLQNTSKVQILGFKKNLKKIQILDLQSRQNIAAFQFN